jgi:hypothetical protein
MASQYMARVLHEQMRDFWRLPPEFAFGYSGSEWLLNLLQSLDTDMCAKVMFLLWRVWHHRNNIVHGDGKASASASVPYLVNYLESFSPVSDPHVDVKREKVLSPLAMIYLLRAQMHPAPG